MIKVAPRPKLSRFKFNGINRRNADKIREEIALYSGKTITENLVFQTKNKIKGYFREKGYYGVKVNIDRISDTLVNSSEIFVINISKGYKIKIKDIQITGNKEVPLWKLKLAMKDTKKKRFWRFWKNSKFAESTYKKDKELLLEKFNAVGLRDAEIVFDTVYKYDEKNLVIKIEIDEGQKYRFGDFEWIGNTKYRSTYLDTILGIKNGDMYNKSLLEQRLLGSPDGRDITALYMDRGYLFFKLFL